MWNIRLEYWKGKELVYEDSSREVNTIPMIGDGVSIRGTIYIISGRLWTKDQYGAKVLIDLK